jgi:hypothetical protein
MNFSAQHIKQLESREANGTISINSLREVANAMDMQLVYGFILYQPIGTCIYCATIQNILAHGGFPVAKLKLGKVY